MAADTKAGQAKTAADKATTDITALALRVTTLEQTGAQAIQQTDRAVSNLYHQMGQEYKGRR